MYERMKGGHFRYAKKQNGVGCRIYAVSYTHLDVYKRQYMNSKTLKF